MIVSIWTIISFVMSGIFGLIGIIFLVFKDKACILISGYNLKTKKEREKYKKNSLFNYVYIKSFPKL